MDRGLIVLIVVLGIIFLVWLSLPYMLLMIGQESCQNICGEDYAGKTNSNVFKCENSDAHYRAGYGRVIDEDGFETREWRDWSSCWERDG